MTKTKFTEGNKRGRTVVRVENVYKCGECNEETHYVDYCAGGGICSHQCYDARAEKMTAWARGERDLEV